MKQVFLFSLAISLLVTSSAFRTDSISIESPVITFYEVPLICGAAPEIGCGSRLKPLFLDMEKEKQIKESWSNRQGTVVAVVWHEPAPVGKVREQIVQPVFKRNSVDAKLITNQSRIAELNSGLGGAEKWYKGMEVDLLSIEEAGIIAESLTVFAKDEGIITGQEAESIKSDFTEYFKTELTKVRSFENLRSAETQEKWSKDGYQIYVDHIGTERADQVSALYQSYQDKSQELQKKNKSCCDKKCKTSCCKKS